MYEKLKQVYTNQNINTSIILILKNSRNKPVIINRIINLDYKILTVECEALIQKQKYKVISIFSISEIHSLSIYDRFQHKQNNITNKILLDKIYNI